jgi:2-keto-4-pentenoate hydratase
MAMTDAQRQEAAEALFHAELTREWIEPITLTYDGADIDDAYAIGQCVTDLKVSARSASASLRSATPRGSTHRSGCA